jgi:hypothetical protein
MSNDNKIVFYLTQEDDGTWIGEFHDPHTNARGLAYGKNILTREQAIAILCKKLMSGVKEI